MANITRFSPWDDAFDELFRGFFVRPVGFEGHPAAAAFHVDVSESENAYTLRAELPGVKKDDINVTVGVLELTLPKKAAVQAKRITVQ